MLSYELQQAIGKEIEQLVHDDAMFTVCEVVDRVRSIAKNFSDSYNDIRSYIHALFHTGRMGIGYKRTSVVFDDGNGNEVSAWVYHPKWKDPFTYVSHKTRQKSDDGVMSFTISTQPTTDSMADPLQAALIDWAVNAAGCGKGTTSSVTTVSGDGCISVTPIPRKIGTGDDDIMYSIDAKGRVVIPATAMTNINSTPGTEVQIIEERKRLTIVKTGDSHPGRVTLVKLDSSGNLRIPGKLFSGVGIAGLRLKIEYVAADDAMYITQGN